MIQVISWLVGIFSTKNATFYLPCFLFNKPYDCHGSSAFTVDDFQSWKKVNDKANCGFLNHVGKDHNSLHKISLKSCYDLRNTLQHIEKIVEKQTSQQVARNRLQLKVSIKAVKWLIFQACALWDHDKSRNSSNRGNFLELIKFLSSYNDEVCEVVLDNALQNASYVSPRI